MNSGDGKSGNIIWKIGLGMMVPFKKRTFCSDFNVSSKTIHKISSFFNGNTSWRPKLVPTIKKTD